ncbi:MAG: PrgI family protein [Patescibacteria group bacterium]|jgi:hypothetical protein
MRTTIVPAQVTTVEDRVAGNLTIAQLLILMAGFGLMTLVYLFMAPKYHFSPTKIVSLAVIALTFGPLAIRIFDKIVAEWLVLLVRYALRPRRYVFTKSDRAAETDSTIAEAPESDPKPRNHGVRPHTPRVTLGEVALEPAAAYRFVPSKKGGLHVALAPTKR